jgi:signal transduction histidine kinase
MQSLSSRRWIQCGAAILTAGLLVGFKILFNPLIGDESPFLLFLAGIMFSAWLGGVWLGLASTAVYAFLGDLLFLTPGEVLYMNPSNVNFQLGLFVLEGSVISWGTSALRQTLLALRQADRHKDDFLAVLAHELRNHLAPIHYSLMGMQVAPRNADAVEQACSRAENQVHQLSRLLEDLSDVSRIRTGKLELRRERTELQTIVQAAVETSRPLITRQGHDLAIRLPSEPLHLDADSARLVQALANLLNNAAKYTRESGRISLVAEKAHHEVHIRVRDTGVGIPADMLPKVFDLFTQLNATRDRSQGGLGIGLSLVRRIVEVHGGTVEAFSEGSGKGSEFLVRLPLAAP